MKKTFYHNFLPTKAEEAATEASGIAYETSRVLVEIRDPPPPKRDLRNPWQIRKVLSSDEVKTGIITLSHKDMFDYVFRHWALDKANQVVLGNKYSVPLRDFTDKNEPVEKRIQVENGPDDTYHLVSCVDLLRDHDVNTGDEIGLFWESVSKSFHFMVLRRGNKL